MEKIRKGDEVVVIAGKDKGKRGIVLRYIKVGYVVVEGVNRVKKHTKPNPVKGVVGGLLEKDMPIHVSNIAIYNSLSKKTDRVGFKWIDDGKKKVRIFKSSGEVLGA